MRALAKLTRALAKQGIDRAVIDAYFKLRDDEASRRFDNLAALLPPPIRTRDEGDPSMTRSLRQVR